MRGLALLLSVASALVIERNASKIQLHARGLSSNIPSEDQHGLYEPLLTAPSAYVAWQPLLESGLEKWTELYSSGIGCVRIGYDQRPEVGKGLSRLKRMVLLTESLSSDRKLSRIRLQADRSIIEPDDALARAWVPDDSRQPAPNMPPSYLRGPIPNAAGLLRGPLNIDAVSTFFDRTVIPAILKTIPDSQGARQEAVSESLGSIFGVTFGTHIIEKNARRETHVGWLFKTQGGQILKDGGYSHYSIFIYQADKSSSKLTYDARPSG